MRKRGLLKRIAALAMSATMALGMMSVANAATIDANQTGTLQIQKLKTGTDDGIEGVQFNYVKVGEFVLDGANNNQVNGFRLTDTVLENYLTSSGLAVIDGTTDVYDGKAIQDALGTAIETPSTKTAIENRATNSFDVTDKDGNTNQASVDIGIYLVVEKSAPAEVTKLADPFIVSVPILETAANGTQTWNYNVLAMPKNDYIEAEPVPTKEAVDENGTKIENPSALIGQTINFKISSTVPEMDGDLVAFDFIDTLSEGLDFVDVIKVMANNGALDIKDVEDLYEVTRNGQIVTISFAPEKIQTAGYTDIAVTYSATLNEKAIVGGNGNSNDFEVQYTNDPGQNVDVTPINVHTYGFTLQKNNEDKNPLSGAEFKLYDADGNAVTFYTALSNGAVDSSTKKIDTAVPTGTDGRISFYGLAAGTYYLEETKAPAGYNLLKERVAVTVSADSTVDGVDITIVNTKGFSLPATGGMGTVIFTIGGIILMIGAAVLLIGLNKRNKA